MAYTKRCKSLTINVSMIDGKGTFDVPVNLSKNLLDPYISVLSLYANLPDPTFVQLSSPSSFYKTMTRTKKNNVLGHFFVENRSICYQPNPIKLYLNNCPETIDIWAEDEKGLPIRNLEANILVEIRSFYKL